MATVNINLKPSAGTFLSYCNYLSLEYSIVIVADLPKKFVNVTMPTSMISNAAGLSGFIESRLVLLCAAQSIDNLLVTLHAG